MLAVSNTSPLRYLVAASHADLLFAFFGEILIPPGVADELWDRGTPVGVRAWIARPPAWLRIHPLASPPDAELISAPARLARKGRGGHLIAFM